MVKKFREIVLFCREYGERNPDKCLSVCWDGGRPFGKEGNFLSSGFPRHEGRPAACLRTINAFFFGRKCKYNS